MSEAKQTPLMELLESVPSIVTVNISTPNPLGFDTQHIPVGRYCHDAATELRRQHERITALEAELMEQARVNGMGSEREAALMAKVKRLEQALDVALEALEKSMYPQKLQLDAVAMLKELK